MELVTSLLFSSYTLRNTWLWINKKHINWSNPSSRICRWVIFIALPWNSPCMYGFSFSLSPRTPTQLQPCSQMIYIENQRKKKRLHIEIKPPKLFRCLHLNIQHNIINTRSRHPMKQKHLTYLCLRGFECGSWKTFGNSVGNFVPGLAPLVHSAQWMSRRISYPSMEESDCF